MYNSIMTTVVNLHCKSIPYHILSVGEGAQGVAGAAMLMHRLASVLQGEIVLFSIIGPRLIVSQNGNELGAQRKRQYEQ
jgi:hypothetical protein